MPSRLLSGLYWKVMVLFNVNFATPSHQTRYIQWEGEQVFDFFFFLFSFWKGFTGVTVLPTVRFFESKQIFKIFSYFCLWKNRNEMWVYIIWTSMRNFSWNFFTFFSKTTLGLYFYDVQIYENLLELFSTPLWISSNYQTFLQFSEKQV